MVHRLLAGFPQRCADAADALDRLARGEAFQEDRNIVHRLRGTAATLGAHEVAAAAARLETALVRGDADSVPVKAAALTRTLSAAMAAIRAAGIESATINRQDA